MCIWNLQTNQAELAEGKHKHKDTLITDLAARREGDF
jgi:hypothetical protein